jgi:hypothetical protein
MQGSVVARIIRKFVFVCSGRQKTLVIFAVNDYNEVAAPFNPVSRMRGLCAPATPGGGVSTFRFAVN